MEKLSKEEARSEVNIWLDEKKISQNKRELQKDSIDTLVCAISEGDLILTEEKKFKLILKFPTEGESPIRELEFKTRIRTAAVATHLQGVKATDVDGRLLAYVCALTSQSKTLIGNLDTEDQSLAQSIAVFFV